MQAPKNDIKQNDTDINEVRLTSDEIRQAEDFYTSLRGTIVEWLKAGNIDTKVQNILLLLPDLFMLLIRLILDPRVDMFHKLEFAIAVTYVISPLDLLPDFLPPIGLLDDAFVIALALSRLLSITGKAGEDVVRELWSGEEDVIESVQYVVDKANDILGRITIVTLLIDRFYHFRNKGDNGSTSLFG